MEIPDITPLTRGRPLSWVPRFVNRFPNASTRYGFTGFGRHSPWWIIALPMDARWTPKCSVVALVAGLVAAAVCACGLAYGSRAAAGADPFGYVGQAYLWLKGLKGDVQLEQPLSREFPLPRPARNALRTARARRARRSLGSVVEQVTGSPWQRRPAPLASRAVAAATEPRGAIEDRVRYRQSESVRLQHAH